MSKRKLPQATTGTASEIFAERLRHVRKLMGLSQRELADQLQVSDKAVSSYEVGRSSPTLETIQLLSKISKRPMGFFLSTDDRDDLDLVYKLDRIEEELSAIRSYLQHKGSKGLYTEDET